MPIYLRITIGGKRAESTANGVFPDKEIYEAWLEEGWVQRLPDLDNFWATFSPPVDGLLRGWDEVRVILIEASGNISGQIKNYYCFGTSGVIMPVGLSVITP